MVTPKGWYDLIFCIERALDCVEMMIILAMEVLDECIWSRRGKRVQARGRVIQSFQHPRSGLCISKYTLRKKKEFLGHAVKKARKNKRSTDLLTLGGDARDQTPCLSHAKRALYHLSYIPLV